VSWEYKEFLGDINFELSDQQVFASCPSNIAIIKYWGKFDCQIPANPSISYTLSSCKTNTSIEFLAGEKFSVETFLLNKKEEKFSNKIEKYFKNIEPFFPWILKGKYIIKTENTFPHSSGIASSASGFGAIAKCLIDLDKIYTNKYNEEKYHNKASFIARLGSGSACRSLYNGLVVWGKTKELVVSSDLYAVKYPEEDIHEIFRDFNDWVLLIHEGEKVISSSLGHDLMKNHPYSKNRFQSANKNFSKIKNILKIGDLEEFIKLTEHEALSLHSMMMMSDPAFILMKSGTLEAINKIWSFRKDTELPLFFTLDAGANIHLLFPNSKNSEIIEKFIQEELMKFTHKGKMIKDRIKF